MSVPTPSSSLKSSDNEIDPKAARDAFWVLSKIAYDAEFILQARLVAQLDNFQDSRN